MDINNHPEKSYEITCVGPNWCKKKFNVLENDLLKKEYTDLDRKNVVGAHGLFGEIVSYAKHRFVQLHTLCPNCGYDILITTKKLELVGTGEINYGWIGID